MLQDTGLKIAAPVSFLSTLLSMWHLENGSAVLTVKKLDVSIDWFLLSPYNGPISQWLQGNPICHFTYLLQDGAATLLKLIW